MDDETTGRLLRIGGMRAQVPTDRARRVKRTFLDECSAVVRSRAVRRRRVAVAAVLALAAGAIVAVRLGTPRVLTPAVRPIVATVERLEGAGGRTRVAGASTEGAATAPADTLRGGDEIETGPTGRVSLRLLHGVSLRFDHGSRARFVSAGVVELGAGAVYVDSGPSAGDLKSVLELHTSFGVVRNIGTQFEVRVSSSSLRVRVRSGLVEVRRADRAEASSARPGTELTLDRMGASSRAVLAYGPEWAWAASLAPPLEMEGRPLAAFLEHLCREQGWGLAYADATLAREASGMILHGSAAGLQPSDALAGALATTGLTHRFEDGRVVVARARQ